MKKIMFCILILAIVSCNQQSKKPAEETNRIVKKYTIEQFYKNIDIYGGSFSPDESKLLVTSNESGIFNLVALPIDSSLSC